MLLAEEYAELPDTNLEPGDVTAEDDVTLVYKVED